MNLLADFGNSQIKLALYDGANFVVQQTFKNGDAWETVLPQWKKDYTISGGILSNVGVLSDQEILDRVQISGFLPLKSFAKLPFAIDYKTPETLGDDRLALAAAAAKYYPNRNTLIVDLGSCITFDFCTADGVYSGGAISPGLHMRYRAMHEFTGRLPLLQPSVPESIQGTSTSGALHAGVYHGIWGEILHQYRTYSTSHANVLLILTGGDASILPKTLKNTIFAEPNFLLEGLCYILQLNETP